MIKPSAAATETIRLYEDENCPAPTVETVGIAAAADEDLQRRVRLFLVGSNLPGLKHVEPEVHGDTVILRGSVRTFYEKQLAVRLSRRVAGVIHVIDSIEARGYQPLVESDRTHHRRAVPPLARPY